MDILAQIACLAPIFNKKTLRQLALIIKAMMAMTGRVTMLGMSRWAEKGGSYRSIQRFFNTVIPWAKVYLTFFKQHLYRLGETYVLGGDETVVGKSGKKTHGLDRFYSSLADRVIPGLSLFTLSLISVERRHSFPILMEQFIPDRSQPVEAPVPEKKKRPTGNPPGRPPGQKNKDKQAVELTAELQHIEGMLTALLTTFLGWLTVRYLVMDGHFGNHNALQMVRDCQLHLISKLRCDMALFFPKDSGAKQKRYGDQIDYHAIPERYLKEVTQDEQCENRIYQMTMLHKEFALPLNVVVLTRTNRTTGAWAHVVLFSSDLDLPFDLLIDYYRLRFQIEFNFRDAKQFWGLEDFMNVAPTTVTNAANLALFMVNLSYQLVNTFRVDQPHFSMLDLKAYFRGQRYVLEIIKWLPQKPEPVLLLRLFHKVIALGRIHPLFYPSDSG